MLGLLESLHEVLASKPRLLLRGLLRRLLLLSGSLFPQGLQLLTCCRIRKVWHTRSLNILHALHPGIKSVKSRPHVVSWYAWSRSHGFIIRSSRSEHVILRESRTGREEHAVTLLLELWWFS